MMTLLERHSLNPVEQFEPRSQPLNLAERASTTTITVGPEAPEITEGDWIRDDTEPGKGIVWRVKIADDQFDTEIRTLQLEHIINTLRDNLMFGEVKPSDMGGSTTCTAVQAIEYILGQQEHGDWVLGTCSYNVSNPYNFNGDYLYDALETVSRSLADCWWNYDMSSYPFTLNIVERAEAISVEMRMSRNLKKAKRTIDRTPMYTRVYPIGKNNLYIDGHYVSRNENIYERKDKTVTDQSKATKAELQRWAEELLDRHCEPSMTVTVTAKDLSKGTGESLDHIVLGARCRMPIPKHNVLIEEIITKISYADKIRDPEEATVTMANVREDVASIINQLIKSGGSGGRTAAKDAEEKHAWFLETNTYVGMLAEACAGEGAAEDWSRVASLVVDGNGIHQRVTQTQEDVVECFSLIEQTSTAIRSEIGNVRSQVYSFVEQTPEMIHSEVGAAVSGIAQSVIEQTATYIRMEVSNAASAISQSVIEQTTEYVRTEVASVASGVAWSVVEQTMTNILQEVHNKSKVYIQPTDPNDGTNVINEGDIWVQRQNNKTWNQANAAHEKWEQSGTTWRSKYGDVIYCWKNNAWQKVKDTAVDVENEVKLEQTKNSLAIVGRSVDINKQEYNSRLEVSSRQIRSEVSTARSQIYSTIEQTATNIRSQVSNEVNGLQSQIEQTASSINTSVSAAKSTLYSTIMQTATNIRSQVVGKNGVISAINQSSEQIDIEARRINLTGYVTAAQLNTQKARIDNLISGTTKASYLKTTQFLISDNYFTIGGHNARWRSFTLDGTTHHYLGYD